MLRNGEDNELLSAFAEDIQDAGTRQAYEYLVGWGVSSKKYECFARAKGYINDVRFLHGDDWHFAFIPNQKWLLFYFRRPCLHLPKYSRNAITEWFPSAQENNQGEFTSRISTIEDAIRIGRYVDS